MRLRGHTCCDGFLLPLVPSAAEVNVALDVTHCVFALGINVSPLLSRNLLDF